MKNPTAEVFAQAVSLRESGQNHREIMAATGLSHSQMERHFLALDIEAGIVPGGFQEPFESNTAKMAWIAKKRLEGESWGLISVRLREPESRTRKAFEESGLRSKGMRIGKGGRYVANEQAFYTGADRAKYGSELVAAAPIREQIPTDFDQQPERKLPTLVKPAKRVRKATK